MPRASGPSGGSFRQMWSPEGHRLRRTLLLGRHSVWLQAPGQGHGNRRGGGEGPRRLLRGILFSRRVHSPFTESQAPLRHGFSNRRLKPESNLPACHRRPCGGGATTLHQELHMTLDPEIEADKKSKRVLLFNANIDDPSLFDEMCNGFKLVGNLDSSGQFLQKWKPGTVGIDQLKTMAKWAENSVVNSCRRVLEDREVADAVWRRPWSRWRHRGAG